MTLSLFARLAGAATLALCLAPASAMAKDYKICWSIYAGYMPWAYAQDSGIVKKWADKEGVSVEFVQINDYVECLNQYTAGQYDGATAAVIDGLSIPAAGGIDTTALLVLDYSNGNDGIVLKGKTSLADIKGQKVNLIEYSISHYFLVRALETVGLTERDITIVNTADADWIAAYSSPDVTAMAIWNPQLATVAAMPDAHVVFDSTSLPGELLDALLVNTGALTADPALGRALVGAWFETMALMHSGSPEGEAAIAWMAKASGTDVAGYKAQLAKTFLFKTPAELTAFVTDPKLKANNEFVRTFLFDKGLMGQGATSRDAIGIAFPDGSVLGDPNNVKLRFDASFVQQALKSAN